MCKGRIQPRGLHPFLDPASLRRWMDPELRDEMQKIALGKPANHPGAERHAAWRSIASGCSGLIREAICYAW
jgi:hypothetical protein